MRPVVLGVVLCLHLAVDAAFLLEAEDATLLLAPAVAVAREGASGGRCVSLSAPEGRDTAVALASQPKENLGTVEWALDLSEGGVFYPWVRVNWHCYCGRSFRFLFSGDGTANEAEGHAGFASTAEPGLWHWERLDAIRLAPGAQRIRIVQQGHLALLDQLFLGSDPNETPPGYLPEGRRILRDRLEGWIDRSGRLEVPVDGEWGSVAIAAALRLDAQNEDAEAGFALTAADGRRVAEVALRRQPGGAAVVVRGGGESPLVVAPVDDGFDGWHSVEATRDGGRLDLAVDGVPRSTLDLGCTDPATAVFFRTGPADIQDVAVADMATRRDLLSADDPLWPVRAGTWHHTDVDGAGKVLVGRGDEGALLDAPWLSGERYLLRVNINLADTGLAGVAFVPADGDVPHAAVLRQDGETRLAIVAITPDGPQPLWASDPLGGDAGQWRTLWVRKWPGQIELGVDDLGAAGRFSTTRWAEPSRPALYAGAGAACFADVRHAALAAFAREYVFEPSHDYFLLAHWQLERGRVAPTGHPAFLALYGDPLTHDVRMSFRRRVGPGVQVELDGRSHDEFRGSPDPDRTLFPAVVMPLLDSSTRFFVSAVSQVTGVTYTALADTEDMRSVRLVRDGELLAEKELPAPSPQNTWKLYLRLQQGEIEAGVRGSVSVSVPVSDAETSAEYDVAFGAVNVLDSAPPRIRSIVVAPACPPL